MKLDFYADLATLQACPANPSLPGGLASGFVDGCTALAARGEKAKREARSCYIQRARAAELRLPRELGLDVPLARPLHEGWLAVEITFTLCTPWYSKDDRRFHVLDNHVRKDRVFGVPYMSAGSWKGLSRWAFRMNTGLLGPEPATDRRIVAEAEAMVLHLFGNAKGAGRLFQRGALTYCPTWFPKVGFEVINPHDRQQRAGTLPIAYEVVPTGVQGALRFLYAPVPGAAVCDDVMPAEALARLLDATDQLLTVYGFSAKRTAGWGAAKVDLARALGHKRETRGSISDVKDALGTLLAATGTRGG